MLDWTKPIEAVHTDGRVHPVRVRAGEQPNSAGHYGVRGEPIDCAVIYNADGTVHRDSLYPNSRWAIRNVEPTLRTSDEALRRMEALVERMANSKTMLHGCDYKEARAIQALRTPIDPRLEPVVRSLVANGISEPVARLYARDVLKALDAASC